MTLAFYCLSLVPFVTCEEERTQITEPDQPIDLPVIVVCLISDKIEYRI
jgi:hypothetical protein